jgi:hypothetical protein
MRRRIEIKRFLNFADALTAGVIQVFNVEGGSLEALVHQAILAPPASACPNCAQQFFRDAHYGCLPRICNASPRTSDSRLLSSTNAASLRRTRHIGDFRAWKDHDPYQNAFERLLRDLKA